MADSTVEDAIADVARFMGMVNGQNMTPYSDDACLMFLRRAHNLIVDMSEWDEMVLWKERELDGVTGRVTQLFTGTTDWKNIIRVYHESSLTPIAKMTSYNNPLTTTTLFGYRGLDPQDDMQTGDGRYLIQFYPATLTGRILLHIRKPIQWQDRQQVIPIDYDWHVYLASHMWACQDGTNPVQIQNLAQLLQERKGQVMAKENSRGLQSQPHQYIPTEWWESDGR